MKLSRGQFSSIVKYLGSFASGNDVVQFRPLGSSIIASIDGANGHAEIISNPVAELESRFAVGIGVLRSIDSVAGDDDIAYVEGSSAKLSCGDATWWIPYNDINLVGNRPDVEPHAWIEVGNDFSSWLSVLRDFSQDKDERGSLDCLLLDVRATQNGKSGQRLGRQTLVASNRVSMAVYDRRNVDCEVTTRLLIEKRLTPLISSTCESGMPSTIRVGLNYYSVQCGRRIATFPVRRGVFPKSWIDVYQQHSRSLPEDKTATINVRSLGSSVRKACADSGTVKLSGEGYTFVVDSSDSKSDSKVECGLASTGEIPFSMFGPVCISEKQVRSVCRSWPSENVTIMNDDRDKPVIFKTGEHSGLLIMVQPIVE